VAGKLVFVLDHRGRTVVFGEDPDDPAKIAAHASAVAAHAKPNKRGVLRLANKKLRVFPAELARYTDLRVLGLEHNPLDVLSPAIGQLRQLEELDLSFCHLRALPDEIGRLTKLRKLNLHLNCVSDLPASFGELASLEDLDLGMNTSLQTLELVGARPMTAVPAALARLRKLRRLVLAMNELADIPAWLGDLPIEELDISSNRFAKFPDAILRLPLRSLSIGYQPWDSGVTPLRRADDDARPVPKGFAKLFRLTSLRELQIDRLDLEELPDAIGALRELETLSIAFTKIRTLPASFYELTNLRTLHADYVPLTAATKKQLAKRLPACTLAS
jgi:Leucine-rich repeat (LRR) protein